MADSKFTDLPSIPVIAGSDVLPIVDISADTSNKVTVDALLANVNVASQFPTTTKGDIFTHNGSVAARLPVAADDSVLITDSTTATGLSWKSQKAIRNSPTYSIMFDDFLSTSTATYFTSGATSGTGANVLAQAGQGNDCAGLLRINTGTTATGRGAVLTHPNAFAIGFSNLEIIGKIRNGNLSVALNTYVTRFGFLNSSTAAPTEGVYFKYDSTISPNWQFTYCVSGVETDLDTGVVVTAFNWDKLRIIFTSARVATGFINGVQISTAISTGIPSGQGRLGMMTLCLKTSGTTAAIVDVDYYYIINDWIIDR